MCASTRFPEVIPLTNATTPEYSKALVFFSSLLGIAKEMQSGQGTKPCFQSRMPGFIVSTCPKEHTAAMMPWVIPSDRNGVGTPHYSFKTLMANS